MLKFSKRLVWEEEGATAVEYGLLIGLIALVMSLGAATLGLGLTQLFEDAGDWFEVASN